MQHSQLIEKITQLGFEGFKEATLETIDFRTDRRLDKSVLHSLASMNFIRSHQNIIITGKTGTGKSYIAQALANRAIMDGFRVYYVRTPSLLEEIRIARIDGTYTSLIKKYSRFQLLILDDFGVSPMHEDDATNLFEIIEDRIIIDGTDTINVHNVDTLMFSNNKLVAVDNEAYWSGTGSGVHTYTVTLKKQ